MAEKQNITKKTTSKLNNNKSCNNKNEYPSVNFLGIGSYNYVKNHDTKGVFYTIDEENGVRKYLLLDKRSCNEMQYEFDTINDLEKYVKNNMKK